jgi:Replicase family
MSHEIDHSDTYNAHRDANLPPPNFIAINPGNGHGHCAVRLAVPVSCYEASRVEPLRFYCASGAWHRAAHWC